MEIRWQVIIAVRYPARPRVWRKRVVVKHYLVKKGDTLSKIAMLQLTASSLWPEIAKANNIRSPYIIFEGMRLVIPTAVLDQRDHVSVHAPAQNLHVQDHVSVHAPVRSIGVSSTFQTAFDRSSASPVMLPKLRIPFQIGMVSVGNPNADISIKAQGEITEVSSEICTRR